jgi:ATP-dependent DNA ligase
MPDFVEPALATLRVSPPSGDQWVHEIKFDAYRSKGRKFDGFYLGEERDRQLVYAGKIESGWTEGEKGALLARVKPLRIRDAPVPLATPKPKARWVDPRVLVDVEYRARTGKSGLLRHPTFRGVREDLMEGLGQAHPVRRGPSTKARRQMP